MDCFIRGIPADYPDLTSTISNVKVYTDRTEADLTLIVRWVEVQSEKVYLLFVWFFILKEILSL
mgnify:CR=1 FL=1